METFWIILVVVFASLVKGITGFGFALISLPLLMTWYAPKEIIPVLMVCNLMASIIIVIQKKEHKLITKEYHSLLIYASIFTLLGVFILKNTSDGILINIMSIFFIVLSVISLIGKQFNFRPRDITYKIVGAILGLITGSISISGPPLALFLNSANVDNQEFREIFSWFSIVTAIIAIVGYQLAGLFTRKILITSGEFLPILFIGSYIGKRINSKLPAALFKKSVLVITLLSSILLLVR